MPERDAPTAPSVPRADHTLRVAIDYKGTVIRIAGSERVAMIAPPSVTTAPRKGQSGFWFELRDAAGRLLFHRALHNPIRTDVEVFSSDPSRSIARVPVAEPEGRFELLVPDVPGAQSLVLYGSPAEPAFAPAKELLRVDVAELRKAPPGTPRS
jgi:hypothetical protein